MLRSKLRSVVDTGLFDYGPQRSRLLVRLWRVLARGEPLGPADIEAAPETARIGLGDAIDFLATVTERDESGRITGLLGWSLNEHPHRFSVRGVALSTWCAIDTLCHRIHFFPDEAEAKTWCEGRGEMEVMPVAAAWRHAVETWGPVLTHASAGSAGSFAEVQP